MSFSFFSFFGCLFLLFSHSVLAQTAAVTDDSERPPLWQAGPFAVQTNNPSYPGADTGQQHNFVLPGVTYRGKILRADENESPRARFFRTDNMDLDLSADAYFSSHSEGTAREGMVDLDYVGELGPRINYWWVKDSEREIKGAIALRSVFSTNFTRFESLGWSFTPTMTWNFKKAFFDNLQLYTSLSFHFLDRGAAAYFFNVESKDARPGRPAYEVQTGYMGESWGAHLVWKWGRLYATAGLSLDDFTRSSFRESPLLKTRLEVSNFFGIGYDMFDSKARGKE